MKKVSLLLATTLILFFTFSYADGPQNPGQQRHFNPAVQQYVKEHIMPVLKEKRALVETELTTGEKSELASDRAALKQLFQQQKEQIQQKPADVTMREYMHSDEQKAQMHQLHEQEKAIVEKAQAIATNHQTTLDNIHSQLEPSHEQWKSDIGKLMQAQKQDQIENGEQQAQPNTSASRSGMRPGMHGDGGMRPALFEGKYAYAHFLLMPAQSAQTTTTGSTVSSDDMDEFQSLLGTESTTTNTGTALTAFQLMPNPASNELITGNNNIPANNELKIIDMQGRVALTLQNVQPAQHISVTQLPSGTYLAQLTGSGQTIENKIVISH